MKLKVRYSGFMPKILLVLLLVLLTVFPESFCAYVPPAATVEPLYPRGIRLSVPDEDGISLVAYHVKINEDFYSLEAGTIAVDIIKKKNGRWVYEDRSTRLKEGDIVYYWVHVVYDGLGYNLLDQHHVVKEFFHPDGTPVSGTSMGSRVGCDKVSETIVEESNGTQRHPCTNDLILDENFDTLDKSRWTVLQQFSVAPDYEFVVYQNNDENVNVRDSQLHIKPVLLDENFVHHGNLNLDGCTGKANTRECKRRAFGGYVLPPVSSGRLNTKRSLNFQYGRVEVRAKLPTGDWIYPLILLEQKVDPSQEITSYQAIRVAAAAGNPNLAAVNGNDIGGHVLSAGGLSVTLNNNGIQSTNRLNLPSKRSDSCWSDNYHTYEIEWRRGSITVKVDGEQYGVHAAPSFNKPMFLTLGVAVGGFHEFPDMSTSSSHVKPWRNVASQPILNFYNDRGNWLNSWRDKDTGLHVDYVKAWAL